MTQSLNKIFSIKLKDKIVRFEDSCIEINSCQKDLIRNHAIQFTQNELVAKDNGLKITLTKQQQSSVIRYKNSILKSMTPNLTSIEIIESPYFAFSNHAYKRITERLERNREKVGLVLPDPETQLFVLDSLINSKQVREKAEWKGKPTLAYRFICKYHDGSDVDVVASFEDSLLIITVVDVTKRKRRLIRDSLVGFGKDITKSPIK